MSLQESNQKIIIKYLQNIVSNQERFGLSSIYLELNTSSFYFENNDTIFHLSKFIDRNNLVLLLGHPGSGKTSTLKRLEYTFAKEYIEHEEGLIPLFIRAYEFNSLGSDKFFETKLVEKGFSESLAEKLLDNGQVIIFLDGLDEVNVNYRKELGCTILESINKYPLCKFVFSSRYGYSFESISKKLAIFELEGLDKSKIDAFVNHFVELHKIEGEKRKRVFEIIMSSNIGLTNPVLLQINLDIILNYLDVYKFIKKNTKSYYFKNNDFIDADLFQIGHENGIQKTIKNLMSIIREMSSIVPEKEDKEIMALIEEADKEAILEYKLSTINLILTRILIYQSHTLKNESKKDREGGFLDNYGRWINSLSSVEKFIALIAGIVTIITGILAIIK